MMISVWRYSHLALAVSSFLLLTLASLSGIILAFEPVIAKARLNVAGDPDRATLAQVVPLLKEKFHGVQELSKDEFGSVVVKWTNKAGKDQRSYVDPLTGQVLGTPREKAPLFQWMTTLHRSLFLHETGRLLVGITSFLLILIALSGIALVIQRQKRFRRFFAPVERTGFAQYYHVVFGRLFLFFILAIALTGTWLSFSRFQAPPVKAGSLVNVDAIREEPALKLTDFPLFLKTRLSDVQTLQFPFSDFPEDYFTLKLKDREVCVNQFTGEVLAQQLYSSTYNLAQFSLQWHTGRSNPVWAIVLAVSSGYILFFIYSGFLITWKRISGRSKNKYKPSESRIIILAGSENGSTFRFAGAIHRQLLQHGEKAYLTDLNNYTSFPKAAHLIVMTSTYGLGDPPANARRFAARLAAHPQAQPVRFSVVGFGSRSYPQFCKFAYEVDALLQRQPWAVQLTELITVDEQSPQDFSAWLTRWQQQTGFQLMIPRQLLDLHKHTREKLAVVHKTPPSDDTFLIRLASKRGRKTRSGDLLAVYPKNDHRERLYSIGKVGGELQLSVKLHEDGLGSQYLHTLQTGETISGRIIKNEHFHFPRQAPEVLMVSNGTGIAPFLGMLGENRKKTPCTLYAGFRTHTSLAVYQPHLSQALAGGKLSALKAAFSREGEKQYVSDLLRLNEASVWKVLLCGGVVMICGSLSMQKDVLALLDEICKANSNAGISAYQEKGQVLTDCY